MAYPFKAVMAVVGLLLVAGVGLVFVLARAGRSSGSELQISPATPTSLIPASKPGIPAIDTAIPAQTQTATFALG